MHFLLSADSELSAELCADAKACFTGLPAVGDLSLEDRAGEDLCDGVVEGADGFGAFGLALDEVENLLFARTGFALGKDLSGPAAGKDEALGGDEDLRLFCGHAADGGGLEKVLVGLRGGVVGCDDGAGGVAEIGEGGWLVYIQYLDQR